MPVRKFSEVAEVGRVTAFMQDDPLSTTRRVYVRIGDDLVSFGQTSFMRLDLGVLTDSAQPSLTWDAQFDADMRDIHTAVAELLGVTPRNQDDAYRISELEAEVGHAHITIDRLTRQLQNLVDQRFDEAEERGRLSAYEAEYERYVRPILHKVLREGITDAQ